MLEHNLGQRGETLDFGWRSKNPETSASEVKPWTSAGEVKTQNPYPIMNQTQLETRSGLGGGYARGPTRGLAGVRTSARDSALVPATPAGAAAMSRRWADVVRLGSGPPTGTPSRGEAQQQQSPLPRQAGAAAGPANAGLPRPAGRGQRPVRLPLAVMRGTLGEGTGDGALSRLCCWGNTSGGTCAMWQRLEVAVGGRARLQTLVCKVERVAQEDGEVRFDVYCRSGAAPTTLAAMRAFARRWGWYVRPHNPNRLPRAAGTGVRRPGSEAAARGAQRPNSERGALQVPQTLRVGTYNINGVRGKKPAVQRLAELTKLHCLALQETLLTPADWTLRIPGYQCFSVTGAQQASERGVALLVAKAMSGYQVASSPWSVFVRVFGKGLQVPALVASIYLPHGQARKEARSAVRAALVQLRRKFPDDPVILLGDWNVTPDKLRRLLVKWEVFSGSAIVPHSGGLFGSTRRRSLRAIDHVVIGSFSRGEVAEGAKAEVLRDWDASDHYPVVTNVRLPSAAVATPAANAPANVPGSQDGSKRFLVRDVPRPSRESAASEWAPQYQSLVNSNRWAPLLRQWGRSPRVDSESGEDSDQAGEEMPVGVGSEGVDAMASAWDEAVRGAAEDAGVLRVGPKPASRPLKRSVARAVDDRRSAYAHACSTPTGSAENAEAWETYRSVRRQAQRRVRRSSRKDWHRSIFRAGRGMREDPKSYWRWAACHAGWQQRGQASGSQPVKDPVTGVLQTDSEGIAEAWAKHYANLARDVTGHSRDASHWRRIWGMRRGRRQPLDGLDGDITGEELERALCRMRTGKAPGIDGVPADVLKLCQGHVMDSAMGQFLLLLLNTQWQEACVPARWRDCLVVSVPKKGDLTDTNNHRGISLIGTAVKLLAVILSARLNDVFESLGLFSQSQAGFRRREECMTQVGSLYEVCQRRSIRGERTYLLFVDVKKAYDTVPHEALFAKLHRYGVRGRLLQYLRTLYASSRFIIRTGSDPVVLSQPVPLLRGLRQGCPMSPVLFNIFINDVLEGATHLGVTVPKLGRRRLPGLLFADDLVAMTPSKSAMEAMVQHLQGWMDEHEMAVGIHKCGLMVVGTRTQDRLRRDPGRWNMGGEPIPLVDSYRYLGVDFRPDLQVDHVVKERVAQGRKLAAMLGPFLRCQSIPLRLRKAVVQGVLVPTLLYGAELYGMRASLLTSMQAVLNQALRPLAGASAKATISSTALWREVGIAPVHALAAARKARVLRKCPSLSTWAGRLALHPARSRRRTWLSGGAAWLNRFGHRLAVEGPGGADALHESVRAVAQRGGWQHVQSSRSLARFVSHAVWRRMDAKQQTASGARYMSAGYVGFNERDDGRRPALASGFAQIRKMRVGGFHTGVRLARRGLIDPRYRRECPCCRRPRRETLFHLFFRCSAWAEARERFLQPALAQVEECLGAGPHRADGDEAVAVLLGGGAGGRRIPEWAGPRGRRGREQAAEEGANEPDFGYSSDSSSDEGSDSGGAPHDPTLVDPVCCQVAAFAVRVMRARAPIIRALRALRGGEQGVSSHTSEGRSPNG